MKPPIPLEDAQRQLLDQVQPLGSLAVPLDEAAGAYLARPLSAHRTQPPADLSAMDGYAMPAGKAGPWRIVGESAAGHPFTGLLGVGEAVRISTGAMMPDGAGAVLLQENAEREGPLLRTNGEGEPTPRHIRRAGFDFSVGEAVLDAGTRLGPAQIALAIAAGHAMVEIHAKPALAILDSGDELASDPTNCAVHQIPASNGAMLAAMARPIASSVARLGPIPDQLGALVEALEQAETSDVIVTSGGASVGDHDLVRPALEKWGAIIDFWRVAMKPGKPIMVARKGKTFILGLPGNPVSSFVTAHLFLLPLLRRLAGASSAIPFPIQVELGSPLPRGGSRLEFRRARFEQGRVTPLSEQDSSALRSLAAANALIRMEPHAVEQDAGTLVSTYLLENGGIA